MAARIAQITIDVSDIETQAEFWSAALGLTSYLGDDGAGKLCPAEDAPPEAVTIWLQPVSEPKRDELRLGVSWSRGRRCARHRCRRR